MVVNRDYEVSSEGAVRHWEIPFASLENATPLITEPAAVLSHVPGTQLTGTVLTVDDTLDVAVIDFTCSMVYRHNVRNVHTYNQGAEATFIQISIGDPIYYDRSATMPANCYLSVSPMDSVGGANPIWGFAVPADDADMLLYPKANAQSGVTIETAVMQVGAGAV
jgi:hypothetical protein